MADVISVAGVTKEYGTAVKTQALRGVSFRVEGKEFLSIIGQSGSGKSTLLNVLGLLDRPTTGAISLLGADVGALNKKQRAAFRNEHLGFVFQFHHLLPEFSVRENLLIPTWIGGMVAKDEATAGRSGGRRVGGRLHKHAEEILSFLGIGELADKSAEQLSGGQKQRVAIARMLLKNSPIMILDDSLSAVDTETDEKIRTALKKHFGDATVILISHRITTLMLANQIIVLDKGRIVESGTHEQLIEQNGIYKKIYDLQMKMEEAEIDA